jgi:two-component system NtrC family sensor kinase
MFTFPFLESSGDLTSVAVFISAMIQLFLAVSMIVLVLEEARATQKTTEERYRTLFEQAGEAIIITNAEDLRILETNRAAERLLGVTAAEAGKHSFRAFCRLNSNPDTKPPTGDDWFEAICRQRAVNLVSKNAASAPVEIAGARIQFDGQTAFQFFVRELTERARLEQQLRQSEKLSALGQMISGIAHELNNPLAVVKGYLELVLAHHELTPQTRADLEKAVRESNRAAKLVGNFLSFARERPAHREMVDFNEVIRRIAELRKSDFLMAGVEPRLELASDLPGTSADPDQVQQVLMNLITNALQAMRNLSGTGQLVIHTFRNGNSIQVAVQDNGPGVPDDLVSKIFEPFFTTKEVGTGTGLGLSIAHSIMTEHGGRIFYQKAAPTGARFVLEFPIIALESAAAATTETVFLTREVEAVPSAKVLVLDDEKALAEMLSEMLAILGHTPTVCHSAVHALELLHEQPFDLVISDFRMPILTGQQFYESAVKEYPALRRRFIFLTGDVMNEETQSFLRSTGNPHLTKPFNLARVREAVSHVLVQTSNQ